MASRFPISFSFLSTFDIYILFILLDPFLSASFCDIQWHVFCLFTVESNLSPLYCISYRAIKYSGQCLVKLVVMIAEKLDAL